MNKNDCGKHLAASPCCIPPKMVQALKARVALAVHKDDVCTAIKEDQELQNLINQA